MKVVINQCFGGFGLSHVAIMRWAELTGITLYPYTDHYEPEKDPSKACIVHYSRISLEGVPTDLKGNPQVGTNYFYADGSIDRADPKLVQVVEELGVKAQGRFARLVIVEIPDNVAYTIEEYDGREHIAESHRTWGEDA